MPISLVQNDGRLRLAVTLTSGAGRHLAVRHWRWPKVRRCGRERGEERLDSAEVANGPRGCREIGGDRGEQRPGHGGVRVVGGAPVLTGAFSRLAGKSGLPPVRLHELRHGAATLMLLAGDELKTIADQLGHASVVLTADTYLGVAVELGLKSAADAARLVLNAGRHPPGGGNIRRRNAPVLAEITA